MDGLSCIKHLREKRQQNKNSAVNCQRFFESAQEALNLGANGYLLKPVSLEAINRIVAKVTSELTQAATLTSTPVSNNNAFLLQKELQRLYASINFDNVFQWLRHSRLAQDNCILLDLTLHPLS